MADNGYITIQPEDKEPVDTLYISSRVKLIPLETTEESFLGNIYKVQQLNNEFYILDNNRRDIKVFNNKGKYVRKLSKMGKGPGEYFTISDFYIDNKKLYVLANQGTINIYKLHDFEFIKNFPKPQEMDFVQEFFVDTFYYLSNYSNYKSNSNIHVFKEDGNTLKKTGELVDLSVDNNSETGSMILVRGTSVQPIGCKGNCGFLFNQSFDNYLYEIMNGTIVTTYKVDFGKNNLPEDLLMKKIEEKNKYMKEHDNVMYITDFSRSGLDFIFKISRGGFKKPLYMIYNKETRQTKMYADMVLPAFDLKIKLLGADEQGFIGILDYNVINNKLLEIKHKQEIHVSLHEKEKQFIKAFDENSNPALIIFTIKNEFIQ